jgi:hypothetical protein
VSVLEPEPRHFSVENLPTWFFERSGEYRKRVTTRACRIEGPFVVDTSEGPLRCADGWLALDARGYPYPIAADEFELIYEPVDPAEIEPA